MGSKGIAPRAGRGGGGARFVPADPGRSIALPARDVQFSTIRSASAITGPRARRITAVVHSSTPLAPAAMTKSRALLFAALMVASLSAFSATASRFVADLSGTWNVSVQTPDQTVGSILQVTQKGDSISGSLESEIGQAPMKGSVKGDTVSFAFSLDMGGQVIDIRASALLTDSDNMNGQMDVAGMGAMPFSARRQK